jgi:hypothetical protein
MNFIFQSSPWWLLACVLAGGLYAGLLYEPVPGRAVPSDLARPLNYGLAALRFLAVALLGLLLLNPLLRSVKTITEKPTVVLAVDNSESMVATDRAAVSRTLSGLKTLQAQLAGKGITVAVRTLDPGAAPAPDNALDQLTFTRRSTDLSALLAGIRSDYEGRNLTDVVLVSDGIVNQGLSPATAQYPFAVHTVGLGDTVARRDVGLRAVVANRIAYLGGLFPLRAEVVSNGFAGQSGTVVLRQNGRELARQSLRFGRNDTFDQLTFQATASQKGVQHFTLEVLPQPGEFSPKNNRQEVYIDVIDGREKILLLGLAPHPDLKAIRAILAKNQNYDIDLRTVTGAAPGSADAAAAPDNKPYDLLVLHQLPDGAGLGSETARRLLTANATVPVLFVLGNQSATGALNPLNPVVAVVAPPNQFDNVSARFNPAFRQVNLDAARLALLAQLPPLSVPYGEYRLLPGSEVVLYQQVGTVPTDKPLLAFNLTGPRKAAVLLGEGLWRWRLEEFAQTEKQDVVDELVQKVVQLISVKEDRRKLRVYPVRSEFVAGETVAFEAELYNDIYERLYDRPVKVDLTDERGISRSYTFSPTETSGRFEISRLPEGVYQYRATATPGSRPETATGQFVVRDLQLEALSTTADHGLLRQVAAQTGGRFVRPVTLTTLTNYLTNRQTPDRLSSTESLDELINQRWLFFVVLLLAGIEWGLRKYFGSH